MIFSDFLKAVSQIGDLRFWRVLGLGLAMSIALLAGATGVVQLLLPDQIILPWFGEIAWLSNLLSGFVLVAMIGASVFLMIPVAALFLGVMLEPIAGAVEAKHYAHLDPPAPRPISEQLKEAVLFMCILIVVNLIGLVIYFASTLLAPVIFWIVNGILLGREYFQVVAMRWLGREGANKMRAKHRWQIWMAGFLMAVPLTIPVINILVPILGVATFTHMFHRLNTQSLTTP